MDTKKKAALIIDFIFLVFVGVVIYIFLKYFIVYLLPFLISFTFVYLLQKPMISVSQKLKIPKGIITVLSLIVVLLALGLAFYYSAIKIFHFLSGLFANSSAVNLLSEKELLSPISTVLKIVPLEIRESLDLSASGIIKMIGEYLGAILKDFMKSLITGLPSFLISTVVSFVSACFFAFRYDDIVSFIKKQLSPTSVNIVKNVKQVVNFSVFNLLKGYLTIMIITFLEMLLGFFILGVKNGVAIALIVSIVDILPIFGTGTILVPWGIISILGGDMGLGIGLLLLYSMSAIARYFIEPKIVGKKVGVNPIVSLMSMFIGLKLFGVLGLIGLPLLASIIVCLHNNGQIRLWK